MSVGIFTWLLQYFPKNRAILVQKLWGEKKLSKSVLAILRLKKKFNKKKFRWPLSSRGGGKALVARPLVDELFFAASLSLLEIRIGCKCNAVEWINERFPILRKGYKNV